MRRKDVWSIPLTMLREAIVNALVHRDDSQRGTPVRIVFFDDRIDIESPGLILSDDGSIGEGGFDVFQQIVRFFFSGGKSLKCSLFF
ncbi:hypothetical protein AGMMS49545_23990 [Betaproteobacteria bacterium]|nr:hypothetical protein AGMMS49545_23990 [Betaproteobacteria bacterium]GHU43053.1 hypothetical protein AGMMS50289_08800 [Betaproteobacteria bacterium]